MDTKHLIESLVNTGRFLMQFAVKERSDALDLKEINEALYEKFEKAISQEHTYNAWFTDENIRQAIRAIALTLNKSDLEKWMARYPRLPVSKSKRKKVGVIMAGNIPMVGFHDLLAVLISGNIFIGKLSSKDDHLLKLVAEALIHSEPEISERTIFTSDFIKNTDAIIATGSNNSSRYFEYYFKNIPHIIRKNRSSVAILSGKESDTVLEKLGTDIFSYFGLGCRNVTKIYLPEGDKIERLLQVFDSYTDLAEHHKYMNNIEYNRSVYYMNSIKFLDNGIVLMRENDHISSPVGVVYYEKYSELHSLREALKNRQNEIQCIVSELDEVQGRIAPGEAQYPQLWDYADNIDTLKFLSDLSD